MRTFLVRNILVAPPGSSLNHSATNFFPVPCAYSTLALRCFLQLEPQVTQFRFPFISFRLIPDRKGFEPSLLLEEAGLTMTPWLLRHWLLLVTPRFSIPGPMMVEISVPNFGDWRSSGDGPLHIVFIVHLWLSSW